MASVRSSKFEAPPAASAMVSSTGKKGIVAFRATEDLTKLCRIALVVTLILVAVDIGLDITCMLFHFCTVKVKPPDSEFPSFFALFYMNYLGENCTFAESDNSGSSLPVYAIWYNCSEDGNLTLKTSYPRTETNPTSVFAWVAAYLVLDLLWAMSSLAMGASTTLQPSLGHQGAAMGRQNIRKIPTYKPWAVMTAVVLVYDLVVTGVFLADIQYPLDISQCTGKESDNQQAFDNYLLSTLVLPMFFSRGGIVWLAVFGLWLKIVLDGKKTSDLVRFTMFGENNRKGRSLSEAQSDVDINEPHHANGGGSVLNRRMIQLQDSPNEGYPTNYDRIDHAEDFVDSEFNNNIKIHRAEERIVNEPFYHVNGAFDSEETAVDSPWSFGRSDQQPRHQHNQPRQYPDPHHRHRPQQQQPPLRANVRRRESDNLHNERPPPPPAKDEFISSSSPYSRQISNASDISDHIRRIGRPVLPVTKSATAIPRARVDQVPVKRSKLPIRTPSGRSVSATDYLEGMKRDYHVNRTPQEPLDEESGEEVERYYVRLKN